MREYLLKKEDGTYSYHNDSHDDCPKHVEKIEIPKGAEVYAMDSMLGKKVTKFFKEGFIFLDDLWMRCSFNHADGDILWKRHTLPEELTFVDDELDIKTATGSDLDKIAEENNCRNRYNGESDEDYRYQLEHYLLERYLSAKSSDDDYKTKIGEMYVDLKVNVDVEDPHGLLELGVDKTLADRQSQYGDFKEVASTTQYLLQMLSSDAMSDVQLEALHMICSKLSRIAHGDPNHKDSWHDIAGYATLVERSL